MEHENQLVDRPARFARPTSNALQLSINETCVP